MWMTESNRIKHFLYAIPSAMLLTFLFALGLAFGMEVKDYIYSKKFDWLDLLATALGGLVGQGLQILILMWLL